ncbi:hypothetical protein GGI01_003477 [Coemansia sp. RSA 376]|nr:hypothetical protein GGI14_001384 [Coemansia sp. S680]KAJ2038203.1 hypothetical protein H4S03_002482 [Coemansia sp. S3946]KAJ2046654.1 hypothetical protein H4S04_004918 [Coemansia sp. S16]KAJ2054766.1 hypothetical protein GGI08_004424 [Coemansia sp. S2]KAJ2074734.1 hypothetical protein GGH13_001117 [Coemansia sp. S155-1]KAJ2116117.1 hypothetical protein IW146_001782 [Coemansia sp. RSA 922]KAJ2259700.1 hypothetical protein GGI01_003477 [Coemansia sp. RSA 376]
MALPTRSQRYWLRTLSMLGACSATTTSGTIYLFSTYGPALSQRLHLTSTQANVAAISANYGQLLSGPFFGWAADTLGPQVLSGFAAIGSFAAFSALAYTYEGSLGMPSWLLLAGYMILVGLASQSANMAAVTTTTKNFKQNRGSAVSLCVAFFGLSPFVLSHVSTLFFAVGDTPDTFGYLKFLSYLGLGTSLMAALSLTVVGFGPSRRYRQDIPDGFIVDRASDTSSGLLSDSHSEITNDEEALLGQGAAPGYSAVPKPTREDADVSATVLLGTSEAVTASSSPNTQAVLDPRGALDGIDYDTARELGGLSYLRDPEAQLLALVLFLCAGIGVFYNNNIGTIVNALYFSSTDEPDPSAAQRLINHHVAVVSLGSFVGRLTIGAVTDFGKRLWGLPRSGILVVVVFCMVLSQIIAGAAENLTTLLVGSALTGLSYGFLFGVMPTLVSVWFGTKHFGANWGMTTVFIGFSGQGLGAFFGYVYDSNMPDQDPSKCKGGACYRDAFVLSMGVSMLGLLAAIVLARRRGDRRRENRRLWEAQEIDHIEYVPFILAE